MLADIKTFEALGVMAFGASSATTYQNEHTFYGLDWLSLDRIKEQLDPLFNTHNISFAKIGLIQNWECLLSIVNYLKDRNSDMVIAWDPILSSSSGYRFHTKGTTATWQDIFVAIDLFTPNFEEMTQLFPQMDAHEKGKELSADCAVLLKGGHNQSEHSNDILFEKGTMTTLAGERLRHDKHGTGCVLSAAIIAYLSMGNNLQESCRRAKKYVNRFLMSSPTLLGSHHLENETYS
jgi:hydroxymethylpyrimidine/phosphomethylpyrimidine kinase